MQFLRDFREEKKSNFPCGIIWISQFNASSLTNHWLPQYLVMWWCTYKSNCKTVHNFLMHVTEMCSVICSLNCPTKHLFHCLYLKRHSLKSILSLKPPLTSEGDCPEYRWQDTIPVGWVAVIFITWGWKCFQQEKLQGTTWCLNYPSVLLFGFLSIWLHKRPESLTCYWLQMHNFCVLYHWPRNAFSSCEKYKCEGYIQK